MTDLLAAEGVLVLVVNLDRATRRLTDLDLLTRTIWNAGARLFVQTPFVSPHKAEPAEGAEAQAAEPEEGDEWTEVTHDIEDKAREHLEYALVLSDEQAFYTDSALMLDRALHDASSTQLIRDYRSALTHFCLQHGIERVVLLCRTSEEGGENSLRRQQSWLACLAPLGMETIDCILSAQSAVKAPVTLNAIHDLDLTNALILFTSVDRLTRNSRHLDDLRRAARDRHLFLVGTCWRAKDHSLLLSEVFEDPRAPR